MLRRRNRMVDDGRYANGDELAGELQGVRKVKTRYSQNVLARVRDGRNDGQKPNTTTARNSSEAPRDGISSSGARKTLSDLTNDVQHALSRVVDTSSKPWILLS